MASQWAKDIHWALVISMLALSGLGIIFIYSAAQYDSGQFAMKQILWVSMGLLAFVTVLKLGYRKFVGASYLFYVLVIAILIGVLIFGETRFGAQRWIKLGPVILQPSEFAKIATLLALVNFLGSHPLWERGQRSLFFAFGLTLLPMALIMKQPDLGTSLLFLPMLLMLLFMWGLRYRYLIGGVLMGLAVLPLLWFSLAEYQKKRIVVFLNPQQDPLGAGYTAIQSKIAVGSGGILGKGYLQGTQGQLQFVPEHHTDFIFSIVAEEFGFMGTLIILFLYGFLFHSCFRVMAATTDIKAKLLAAGIIALLFSQVFINIGMSFGLMPITGLTLPLISYGGSSFLVTAIALGLVLSIYRERSIF